MIEKCPCMKLITDIINEFKEKLGSAINNSKSPVLQDKAVHRISYYLLWQANNTLSHCQPGLGHWLHTDTSL